MDPGSCKKQKCAFDVFVPSMEQQCLGEANEAKKAFDDNEPHELSEVIEALSEMDETMGSTQNIAKKLELKMKEGAPGDGHDESFQFAHGAHHFVWKARGSIRDAISSVEEAQKHVAQAKKKIHACAAYWKKKND